MDENSLHLDCPGGNQILARRFWIIPTIAQTDLPEKSGVPFLTTGVRNNVQH